MEKNKKYLKWSNLEKIENDFTYHPSKEEDVNKYTCLRNCFGDLVKLIVSLTPDSPEREEAIKLLQLSNMMANAGLSRVIEEEKEEEKEEV